MLRKGWLVLVLAAAVAACDENPVEPGFGGEVASVTVAPGDTVLAVGQSGQLRATVRDGDGTVVADSGLTWQSSDTTVARVSATGLVQALKAGTTQLQASAGGRTGQARVVVVTPQVASVEADRETIDAREGDEVQLTIVARDASGASIPGLGIQWLSSLPEVASVDAVGRVSAIRAGSAIITARVHGLSVAVPVTVTADHPFDLVYATQGTEGVKLLRLPVGGSGAEAQELVSLEPMGEQPRLSPDGTRVAFQCVDHLGSRALCVANRDGSDRILLAWAVGAWFGEPAWSHDGTRLAFVRHGYGSEGGVARRRIGIVHVEGGEPVILTGDMPDDQYEPVWSPLLADGSERIAFTSGTNEVRSVWTMRLDGSDRHQVTVTPGVFDAAPDWSPDGETLVFQRIGNTLFDLRLVDAQGGNDRRLGATLLGNQVSPAWSPDGRMVAFLSDHETYATGNSSYQIYTVWADGTKVARRSWDSGEKGSLAWLAH